MNAKERLNALELALNNEKTEREFYLKHAARTKNKVGKRMFQQIADDELEHYKRLKELHEKWSKNEKWPETVPLKVSQTNVKDVLQDVVSKVGEEVEKDADDIQALEIATRFEDKGVSFYAKLAETVEDPREKDFFKLLSQIEREHFLSLKETLEYLKDPAAYFVEMEKPGLDGA
ncbi:MAG: ferritin family protein [Pseudomonadota bacterium]